MRKIIITCTFILSSLYSFSQNFNMVWSEEIKKTSLKCSVEQLMPYKVDNGIALISEQKSVNAKHVISLFTLDENLSKLNHFEYEFIPSLNSITPKLLGVIDDKIIISDLKGDDQKNTVFTFSSNQSGSIKNKEILYTGSLGKEANIYFSSDSSRVLLTVQSKTNKVKCIIYNRQLEKLSEYTIQGDDINEPTKFINFTIDNSGNVVGFENRTNEDYKKVASVKNYRNYYFKRIYFYNSDFELKYTKDLIYPDKNFELSHIKLMDSKLYVFSSYYMRDSEFGGDNGISLLQFSSKGEELKNETIDFKEALQDQPSIRSIKVETYNGEFYLFAECINYSDGYVQFYNLLSLNVSFP